jgi:hypothetical protein
MRISELPAGEILNTGLNGDEICRRRVKLWQRGVYRSYERYKLSTITI